MKGLRRVKLGWVVALVLIIAFWCVLLVDGFVHPTITDDAAGAVDREDGSTTQVSDAILDGGSVIETSGDAIRSGALPPMTVALTFDDGPDPTWTPEILAILRKYDVPGTFFVLGSKVAQYPQIARDTLAQGSEIGLHTFSHIDLAAATSTTIDEELSRTLTVLAGATGKTSYLMRPPYSSGPSSLTGRQLDVIKYLGARGQMTILSDVDGRDWERPGVDEIVKASTPADGTGAFVLLHDAGGDRAETVAALDKLIPLLKSKGFHFTTVTKGMGLPEANTPADPAVVREGVALVTAVQVADTVVNALSWTLLVGAGLMVVRLAFVLVVAGWHYRVRRPKRFRWGDVVTEPVSVVVPAYNEKACIESTVRSLIASTHTIEVIVVDDGSTDGTADIVEALNLPGVRVIRQENAGKPAALNHGIAVARYDLIVMMDGDTVFEPSTVHELVQPFADPGVGAVAGNAKVSNRSKLVARLQHIEYVIGFNLDRRAYDMLQCMPTVPGAVGGFRRSALRRVGGLSDDTLAEDTDLTMAIVGAGYRVVYQETARAWTEAPETLRQLWRQRYRWSYGTMQSMWKHRRSATGGRNAPHFGRLALAHLAFFQIVLPLLAPLIDVYLVYGLIFQDPVKTLLAWGAILLIQLVVAGFAFWFEREKMWPLLLMPLQQIVYRQLMYAVLFKSVATAVGGVRLRWQKMNRIGAANASRTAGMGSGAARPSLVTPGLPASPDARRPLQPAARQPAGPRPVLAQRMPAPRTPAQRPAAHPSFPSMPPAPAQHPSYPSMPRMPAPRGTHPSFPSMPPVPTQRPPAPRPPAPRPGRRPQS